jgi:hypothetical protein
MIISPTKKLPRGEKNNGPPGLLPINASHLEGAESSFDLHGVYLIQMNALSPDTLSYGLVKIAAKRAIPNGQNGRGKPVFAITKIFTFLRSFRHIPLTSPSF